MRHQRHDTGPSCEFRLLDVPGALLPALVVADGNARRVGDLLLDGLVEPVVPADRFCRAVLGARAEGSAGWDLIDREQPAGRP